MNSIARNIVVTAVLACSTIACAGTVVFTDSFDRGASPLWGNNIGNWFVTRAGTYRAAQPTSFPNANSALPMVLTDCSVELDVNDIQDGGVWLRSAADGGGVGRSGVLLVTGGQSGTGSGLYWHIVPPGGGYGGGINGVGGLFQSGVSDVHLRVEVVGDTYSAYVNGSDTPATTLVTDQFPSGQVALYDFSNQTVDNVVVTDLGEPTCTADLNGDGVVDAADLAILLGGWGQAGTTDVNGDGNTDAADLAVLLGAWGPC